MPEGDSIVRAARKLQVLSGQQLVRSDLRIPSLATVDLRGATVLETVPRGKHLLVRLDTGLTLHSHLKMEGSWSVHPVGARWRKPWHTARVVLRTRGTEAVGFSLLLDLVRTEAEDRLVGHLGPDLLGPDWDAEAAVARLAARPDRPLGEALLDQRLLAGIGNVFKSEVCFAAGVDPADPVGVVPDLAAVVAVAKQQLEANRDRPFRVTTEDPVALRSRPGARGRRDGGPGGAATTQGRRYWVYGHRGPCARCGTTVRRSDQGPRGQERSTYWCPRCQPARRVDPGPVATGSASPPPR
ncbi:endonuclease-8 [Nocardioides scoriae]|uniref:DNA-(apurinic or apyrimidinic site) lyase n=1 Tax=Nocardioides scoriae TaxID=642780 RepID=A0A1H1RU16_9ACTN|nr:DNA-formamidopyrimidine glycosylase family protein [Nocardioides scoriae]SDS38499.1 endonuclease-8 [Nocardioides scoriae]